MKEYSIGYIDRYGDFAKIRKDGRTEKYTFEEARERAAEFAKTHRDVRIYKGWTIIESVKGE